MRKQFDVIAIGSAFVDYFFEADKAFLKQRKLRAEIDDIFDEETLFNDIASSLPLLAKSPGGASLNTAAILSCLGLHTAYHGVVGEDSDAEYWYENLPPIDTKKTIKKGTISRCACILTQDRKEKTYASVVNRNDNEFFSSVDGEFLQTAQMVHISPFYLDFDNAYHSLVSLVERIDKPLLSLTTALGYASYGLKKLSPLLKNVDIIFVNQYELSVMTGKNNEMGSKELLLHGPKIVVCTMGEKGALITTEENQFYSPGKKVQKIIDTTGAGDAFAAGFLCGFLQQKKLEECANLGNEMGALSVIDYGLGWLKK